MTDKLPKRRVGRPSKTDATDANAIIKEIENKTQRFSAKCADNLDTLFDVIYNVATTKDKNIGIKDKVSAAKYCIEQAEKFLTNPSSSSKDKQGNKKGEENSEEEKEPQISLKAV